MRLSIAALFALVVPTCIQAQGTATITPDFPARGSQATISYNATGGPLAGASPVWIEVSFNGFTNGSASAMAGTAPNWSHTFTVPANATSIDVYFRNAAGNTFDSNGGSGIDWQFLTAETQTAPLGVSRVDGGFGGGYLFRVWSPNSTRAAVSGDFNGFSERRDEMRRNTTTNVWTAHVPGATSGQQYKYRLNGSNFRKDPRARRQVNSVSNSIIYDPNAFDWNGDVTFTPTNIRDIIIYEAHLGSFDLVGGSAPSNFQRILGSTRLDYLQDLGITMVHLMPVFEFPGGLSAGYNPSDPFAIEADYGGPDGFKDFVKALHQRGIGAMIDVVHNHYGPSDLELYGFDSAGPGIYFYDSPQSLAETPFGPRPDYAEPQVRTYIKDNIAMLRDEYRVDGFRWDFTKAIRGVVDGGFNVTAPIPEGISLLREINDTLSPDATMYSVAEDLANESLVTTGTGNPNGLGFRAQWDGGFHFNIVSELAKANDADRNMGTIAGTLGGFDFSKIVYVESHDEVWEANGRDRTPWRFDSANGESYRARKMGTLAAGLLFTAEAVPLLFQGSEILEQGGADRSWDVNEGTAWSRLGTDNIARFHQAYRDLIALRRNVGGATAGLKGDSTNIYFVGDPNPKAIAFSRSNGGGAPGDTVVVLANFSSADYTSGFDIGFPQAGTWYELFNSDNTRYGSDFSGRGVGQTVTAGGAGLHGQPSRGTVFLGPYSIVILSRARVQGPGSGWQVR